MIYPLLHGVSEEAATQHSAIQGPDNLSGANWRVQDNKLGSIYKIMFFRDPEDCEPTAMKIEWEKVREEAPQEPTPNYYVLGAFNRWGEDDMLRMYSEDFKTFYGEVPIQMLAPDPSFPEQKRPIMPFKLIMHKLRSRVIHPDKDECTQLMKYNTVMDDQSKGDFS